MVKGAQTKLEGMKESKRSKTFEHTTKINQYNDAQNQMKKKEEEKRPKPNTRVHDGPSCKSIPRSRNP